MIPLDINKDVEFDYVFWIMNFLRKYFRDQIALSSFKSFHEISFRKNKSHFQRLDYNAILIVFYYYEIIIISSFVIFSFVQ